ncbi:MAG: hypothetical protein JNK70_05990, partial [Phycisphaerae bacterium]|nr:hypothetical protein [Phycisphaerae bacterium]
MNGKSVVSVRRACTIGRLVAVARGLGGSRLFRRNYEQTYVLVTGRRFGVFDGLIEQQG